MRPRRTTASHPADRTKNCPVVGQGLAAGVSVDPQAVIVSAAFREIGENRISVHPHICRCLFELSAVGRMRRVRPLPPRGRR